MPTLSVDDAVESWNISAPPECGSDNRGFTIVLDAQASLTVESEFPELGSSACDRTMYSGMIAGFAEIAEQLCEVVEFVEGATEGVEVSISIVAWPDLNFIDDPCGGPQVNSETAEVPISTDQPDGGN